ncbi:cytochrome c oxidase subunit 3 [Neolewinella lacunae]|uniref:Heme-copper oxidase subunit III n=1 Tax=Neolewinella lacunae TaxID=1517758 RepID=A0A923TF97_9BACT|nr:cytochrome c oxidase subunit 3 [Neolewinella lacunae]MBC6996762.1 heme-copper oxidase subunit III [Neolewinella lacunae]MDN3633882.1 cytochrome c oxidase subunit 3 [Neolewinella lacunae]
MKDRPYELPAVTDEQEDTFVFHPKNVILTLLLSSLTMLFLAMTAAFVYTRVQSDLPPIKLPLLFLLNTAILLGSSYTMILARRAYLADDTAGYTRMLWYTLGLSFFFLGMQCLAWYQLFNQQIYITSDNSAGYLYVISGLHFAHVIGGIPFLGVFLYRARKYMKEPVSVLVYFSDPAKRLNLRLLTMYWHFLDALWIYLVLFFFVNQLIWQFWP